MQNIQLIRLFSRLGGILLWSLCFFRFECLSLILRQGDRANKLRRTGFEPRPLVLICNLGLYVPGRGSICASVGGKKHTCLLGESKRVRSKEKMETKRWKDSWEAYEGQATNLEETDLAEGRLTGAFRCWPSVGEICKWVERSQGCGI
jgi:hypothetical protein